MPPAEDLFNRLLKPVGDALTPEAARRLVELRADPAAQERIDELADRCNEGLLTTEEQAEYNALIAAAAVIAVLQSKARGILASNPAA